MCQSKVQVHDISRNTLTANTDGVRVGWGDAPIVWAELKTNTITNNVAGVNASAWDWVDPSSGTAYQFVGRVTLRVNNVITGNTYGIYVRYSVTHTFSVTQPWANATGNTITGNTNGVYLQGVIWAGTTYSVYADVHENNTVASNTYGVWVDGATVNLTQFRVFWNDIRANVNQGVHVTGDPPGPNFFHAECNYWNSAGGPDDLSAGLPDQLDNPDPNAQPVSDWFYYRDPSDNVPYWLDTLAATETECLP